MKAEHEQIKMKQRQWRKYREKEEITDGEEEELRSKIVAMIPERIRRKSDRREINSVSPSPSNTQFESKF